MQSTLASSKSLRNQIRSLLTSKWALLCFGSLCIMEMISATSSVWLVLIMTNITAGESFLPYLGGYIGSLLLPSIPWSMAFIFRISWRQEAQRSFINTFIFSNRNNITEWNDRSQKEQKLSVLTSEGTQTINGVIDYGWDIVSFSLSVFFNMIALSIVVEPLFAIAFMISLVVAVIAMKLRRSRQLLLTQKALSARIDLGQSLLTAWDNVLLGNTYNFLLWNNRTTRRVDKCLQRNVDLELFDQMMAIAISLITMIPAFVVVVYYVFQHANDSAKLASFFVTIPTFFLILSYTYQLLANAFRWGMHKNKLTAIFNVIEPNLLSTEELEKKVKWDKIHFTKNESSNDKNYQGSRPFASPEILSSQNTLLPHVKLPGRITLRGENGSGKSTTLVLIKNSLKEKAFILPTTGSLTFTTEKPKNSTGENLRQRLTEIFEKVNADTILLDEWDANLDHQNRESLSQLIDEIAEKKCVIEVRHR